MTWIVRRFDAPDVGALIVIADSAAKRRLRPVAQPAPSGFSQIDIVYESVYSGRAL